MGELQISRRRLVGAGAIGALGLLLVPEAVLATGEQLEQGVLLRWDLVQILQGVALAGGTDVGRDAATADTISLTGSGQALPARRSAAGGGTFVHKHANGSEVAHGVYVVTAFNSFANGGGSLAPAGLTDGIGEIDHTTGGVLSLNVRLLPATGGSINGVLEIHCDLPGSTPTEEGFRLSVLTFNFVQDGGFTLFHELRA